MSNMLSEVDRELLGEVPSHNDAEATVTKANGGHSHGAVKESHGIEFTPLNATAGTLVKVSSNGDELEAGEDVDMVNNKPAPKTPKKRGAATAANEDSAQPAKKRSPVKKATAPANGDMVEPNTPSPKKRASPKKKNVADANVKAENGETDGETEGLEPVTPKKGKRAPAKGKATKTNGDVNTNDESTEATDKSASPTKGNQVEGTTVHNTPRKRQAPKKELAAPRGIPTSWDKADDADKMLMEMKQRGEGWNEIRAAWKAATGQDTASSTLPNRYNRIKVNMMRMKDGDHQHLLLAKKDVEDANNANFWANVAINMERRGADKYPTAFLQKTFKELENAGKAVVDPADAPAADTTADATTDTATNDSNDDVVMKEEETAEG